MRQHDSHQGQRQLRVGAEIRASISAVLQRGHFRDPELAATAHKITVTEVRISPDLKNATAFVMPLGGQQVDVLIPALNRAAPFMQAEIARGLQLRYTPKLSFKFDDTFDNAAHIDGLLRSERVARDIAASGETGIADEDQP